MMQWLPDLVALALGVFVAASAVVIGRNALKLAAFCFVLLVIGRALGLLQSGHVLEFLAGVVLGAPIVAVQWTLLKIKNRGRENRQKLPEEAGAE